MMLTIVGSPAETKSEISHNKKEIKKDNTKTNQTTAKLIELFDGEILN